LLAPSSDEGACPERTNKLRESKWEEGFLLLSPHLDRSGEILMNISKGFLHSIPMGSQAKWKEGFKIKIGLRHIKFQLIHKFFDKKIIKI